MISPKDVNVKTENAPSSAEKKHGRSSKAVPKGMRSTTKLLKKSLQRGRKVFNGATTCNFSFPYFNSIRVISPKNVNVNAKEKRKENREKLKSRS